MEKKTKWTRVLYILGVIALIIGALDPLEGSVVIAAGSALLALSTYLTHDRHRVLFMVVFIMMVIGVFFMFYFSSLGGFGGNALSWWYGTLVLPYPLAWLFLIVLLIVRGFQKKKLQS